MVRSRARALLILGFLIAVLATPTASVAASEPSGLNAKQRAAALQGMSDDERAGLEDFYADSRWKVVDYVRVWISEDGSVETRKVASTGTTTTKQNGKIVQAADCGCTLFQGLYISITVARDTDITFEYRYDIRAYFDWQGVGRPWNGVFGDDGFAVYWARNLSLHSSFFWGKYRNGHNLMHVSTADIFPNAGVAYAFWEAENNDDILGSIADYGWLTATVKHTKFRNLFTDFVVKYIHTWRNNDYSFSWGAGPTLSFNPTTGSQGIAAKATIKT